MADQIPERIRWAVATLDVTPGDRILEIGGGPGLAAALICAQLRSGRMYLIDRSTTAIERTRRRNAEHVAAGRLVLETIAIADFVAADQRFDKVFAVNVNVFWTSSGRVELARVRQALDPGGKVFLFYETPSAARAEQAAERVTEALRANGFEKPRIVRSGGNRVACIAGRTRDQADAPV